jgi:FixJ family two-component response regulator
MIMPKREKILFVDDEENILKGFRRMLHPDRNIWDLKFAQSAADALKALKEQSIDLVITDMMMPGASGRDLMTTIQKNYPRVPVIMVTGKVASIEAAVECIKAGACDYLSKPVTYERLKKAIKKGIAAKAESQFSLTDTQVKRKYLDDFEIKEPIDEGSAGIVFLAERNFRGVRQEVALKVLKSMDSIPADERQEAMERFAREGAVAADIDHPNIVKVYHYGIADAEKIPYIAMEYIQGETLCAFLEKNGKTPIDQRLGIICDIASALSAVHDQNIYHRDIKPGNIIIDQEGVAKLTDFGLASIPNSTLTMVSSLMGSPSYMSPESFRSNNIDHRSDLYSLGIVAYEVITGKLPFKARNLAMLAYEMQNPKPIPIKTLMPNIPVRLEKALMKLLAKHPEDRFQTAEQVIKVMQSIKEECR